MDGTPHFTLGQAIIDNTKVNEKYYSLSAEAQKNLGILNCGFRVIELNDNALKGLLREILCVAPTIGKSLASLAEKNLICGVCLELPGNKLLTMKIELH